MKTSKFFDRKMSALLLFMALILAGMIGFGPKETLDMKYFYTGDQARALLRSFSESQSQLYFVNELFDLVFIGTYTTALVIAMKRLFPGHKLTAWLSVAPGAFDLVETGTIIYALKTPGSQQYFDWLGFATCLKWTTGAIAVAALLWGARLSGLRSSARAREPR
jgi:hypothetical protein